MDYLILPLIARKLIAETQLEERDASYFINLSSWIMAIPIELARFSAGIALTLLLAPVVALFHLTRAYLPVQNTEEEHSSLNYS